ncbi:putative ribonuclease H protein, partial [Trifolium medium]|nr:putative ribonuclease H protein [Trifolium medium]
MCDFCGDQVETVLHAMRDCPLVMPLWLNMVHPNRWMDWRSLWATACHLAWIWRNQERHGINFAAPAAMVMRNVHSYALADQALRSGSNSIRMEHFISWEAPPEGWIRLNTDGSCREDGHIGCGGIIRGRDGEWIGGFAKFVGHG